MDLDTLLTKWDESKKRKIQCEKECEQYRSAVERFMNKKNTDTIDASNFIVSRRSTTRQSMAKSNVPLDLWNRYSTRSTFKTYNLKVKK